MAVTQVGSTPSCCAAYCAYGAKLCAKAEGLEASMPPVGAPVAVACGAGPGAPGTGGSAGAPGRPTDGVDAPAGPAAGCGSGVGCGGATGVFNPGAACRFCSC